MFNWLFKKSKDETKYIPKIESVKPSEDFIDSILNETYNGAIPYQYVNWAAEQIGEEVKYHYYYPITPKSLWVLFEGCKKYRKYNKAS